MTGKHAAAHGVAKSWTRLSDSTTEVLLTDQCFSFQCSVGLRLNLVQAYRWPAAAAAKSLQSYSTLCDPIDGSPPGSPVPGILQARTLEWVAISFSNAWKWKVNVKSLRHVRLRATPWTAAHQAPMSMGFSRQEYWSGLPLPSLLGNCKSKLQWGITSHWSEWQSSKILQIINAGEGVEKREPSYILGGNVNWYIHYGE